MEGPSLIILKEEIKAFKGREIIDVSGNTKIEKEIFKNKKVKDLKSWGKHFLIYFDDFLVKIHFLMFGSYRVNEKKEDRIPKLSLVKQGITVLIFMNGKRFTSLESIGLFIKKENAEDVKSRL